MNLNAQFVVDSKGERTAVILPISEYAELLEDLEALGSVAERANEPTVSIHEVLARLKRDGKLPNRFRRSAEKDLELTLLLSFQPTS